MEFRLAILDDIPRLVQLRKLQLIDEGSTPEPNIDKELTLFFEHFLKDGSLHQLLAIENDEIVASGAIIYYRFPPSFSNPTGTRAYVTNIYTQPEYRNQGISQKILYLLLDDVQSKHIKKVFLGASTLGRPVYEKLGFESAPEWMEINF